MSKRQFLLGVFILITVVTLSGSIGYFVIESRKVDVVIKREETNRTLEIQKEKTERTKERWAFLNSMPWVKK